MDKCPHCGAETRPGDNFCLSCGNRLLPATPSLQQAPTIGDSTLPAQEGWAPPADLRGGTMPASSNNWSEAMPTIANTNAGAELPTLRSESNAPTAQATMNRIEQAAQVILKSDSGEVLKEYPLDKEDMSIGRAPSSNILLSKDKLTSRHHATIHYENGEYILRDERSANGTFVNGQQLDEMAPYTLHNGDRIGIGEHELIFNAVSPVDVEEIPTVSVAPPADMTFKTQEDAQLTAASGNDVFRTMTMSEDGNSTQAAPLPVEQEPAPVMNAVIPPEEPVAPAPLPQVQVQEPVVDRTIAPPPLETSSSDGMTFNRLTNLSQPTLPDMSALMAALATLDGQVSSMQEQLNATQEAMRNHDAEITQTSNQLRDGVRRVSDRMDSTIADVARSREQMAWAELLQLMEDVTNNPRDIEYVTRLARKARELNKVFQIHQNVLNTLAECNSLLRSLIGENR
ncbi:MAG: FHA domain-containing protein [Chloroflexota bacterium]|nr:FHA domain-containing protein [Chloroflexota bacterium]